MMSLQEIKEKGWEKEDNFFSEKVMRPVSYYPAWLLIKLGVSANTVTCFNLTVGLAGLVLLGLGGYVNMVAGASLLLLNYFLDRVDGSIARATGTSSSFGGYIDSLGDYVIDILVPVALGFGLAHSQNLFLMFEPNIYIYLGIAYALFRIVRRHATLLFRHIFSSEPTTIIKQSLAVKVGAALYYLEYLFLLAFSIFGIAEVFLLLYLTLEVTGTAAFVRAAFTKR